MTCMIAEQSSWIEPVDEDTVKEINESAIILSRDVEFRKMYASKKGTGAIWLDKMLMEASQPYRESELMKERELWKWIKEARKRKQEKEIK